jgi:hypothetical protein
MFRHLGQSTSWTEARTLKFRQSAFVYLHVALLYEAAGLAMWRNDMLPTRFGPPWIWLVAGALIAAVIVVGLYFWQNAWLARGVWALHGLRLPALVDGAFFRAGETRLPGSFYLTAMVVVLINLWMLARAGWDL